MLIDWFTVGAQAINFAILVWLLRRYLYRPILAAIDARETKVAAELASAAAQQAEANEQREAFQHKSEEVEQQRGALLKKATEEANAERARLIGEARRAADSSSQERRQAMKGDAQRLSRVIRRRAQEEVFAIARRALMDLAKTDVEERVVGVFIERVEAMDAATKTMLANATRIAAGPVAVRSAFELPATARAAIQDALNRAFSAEVRISFETAPELVSGIECATNGHKVAWSVADYLASLEEALAELLREDDKAAAPIQPAVESP